MVKCDGSIGLGSEVLALATDSGSTVMVATTRGLVVPGVPRLWTRKTTPEPPTGTNLLSAGPRVDETELSTIRLGLTLLQRLHAAWLPNSPL
jgi:hypothetical protein